MDGLTLPPPPTLSTGAAWTLGAGLVLLGMALLLWGRRIGRIGVALAAAGTGWLLGHTVSQHVEVHALLLGIAGAITSGLLGLVLARLAWALLGGALAGGAAFCIAFAKTAGTQQHPKPGADVGESVTFSDWLAAMAEWLGEAILFLWERAMMPAALAVGASFLLIFLLLLIRGRLGCILMTCLLGATAAVTGAVLIATDLQRSWWNVAWQRWYFPAGVVGALVSLGLFQQYRAAIRADRESREGEPPEQDDPQSGSEK